jgi:(methylthio)acryloyl-CoA hydratase
MALVTYELRDGIAIIRLNRPEKRNAISDAMLAELDAAVKLATAEAKAAVLAGNGAHFSAGLDLSEQSEKSVMEGLAGSRSWHDTFSRIQRGTIPFISALHGAVVGGGLELASNTHIRVADTDTHFALPEGKRGIFVGGSGSVNVTRLLGVPRMLDMMLTGRIVTTDEAERWGIVNYVTEPGKALEKALELAQAVAQNAPLSNYAAINGLQRIRDSGYDEGLFFESMIAAVTQSTPEAIERMRAFIEKRDDKLDIPNRETDV